MAANSQSRRRLTTCLWINRSTAIERTGTATPSTYTKTREAIRLDLPRLKFFFYAAVAVEVFVVLSLVSFWLAV